MDPDLLLAIALSESLMDNNISNNNNNNNNNNNIQNIEMGEEEKQPEDKICVYLKELTGLLKKDSIIKDLKPLLALLKSKELLVDQIYFLSKILESISFKIVSNGKENDKIENQFEIFCKETIKFCLNTLDRWGSSEIDLTFIPTSMSLSSNGNNKKLIPLTLLSIIDMLCCIELPTSSEIEKSFENSIPSFLNLTELNDKLDSNGSFIIKNDDQVIEEVTIKEPISIPTNINQKQHPETDNNIFNQFLNDGLKVDSLTELLSAKSNTIVTANTTTATVLPSKNSTYDEGMESFVKINSNYFNNQLFGPSRLLSISSKLLIPYQSDTTTSTSSIEKYELFKKDQVLIESFIINVQDILFTENEGFENLDRLSVPWIIDFLGRLIGTLRSLENYSISNGLSFINSKFLSRNIFENIFQVLGSSSKLNYPNLQTKAEIFFSLCILSDADKMDIDIVKLLERDQSIPLDKQYLTLNPQLIIFAIELVFKNIKKEEEGDKEIEDGVEDRVYKSSSSNNNKEEPITKFRLSEPLDGNDKNSIWFDFLSTKTTTSEHKKTKDLFKLFIKPQLLDTIFKVLYISYFKKSSNKTIDNNSIAPMGTSSTISHNLSSSTKSTPIPINNVNNNNNNRAKSPIGKSQDSYNGEDDLFGGLFEQASSTPIRNSSSSTNRVYETPKPTSSIKESSTTTSTASTSNSNQDISKCKIFTLLSFIYQFQSNPMYKEFIKSNLTLTHLRVLFTLISPPPLFARNPKSNNPIIFKLLTNICFLFCKNSIMSDGLMDQFIDFIFNAYKPSQLFILPKEQLAWLSWIFVKKQSNLTTGGNNSNTMVIKLWDNFLKSSVQICKEVTLVGSEYKEVISLDYIFLLLFSFHTLDEKHRLGIIGNLYQLLNDIVVEVKSSSKFLPNSLMLSRCLMIFNYILFHFDSNSVSPVLSKLFNNQVLSFKKSNYGSGNSEFYKLSIVNLNYTSTIAKLNQKSAFLNHDNNNPSIPEFYDIHFATTTTTATSPSKTSGASSYVLSPIVSTSTTTTAPTTTTTEDNWFNNHSNNLERISNLLSKATNNNGEKAYEQFYDNLVSLCSLVPTVQSTQDGSSLDSLLFDYIITSSLKFLSCLPLSTSFLKAIKDSQTFKTVSNTSPIFITFLKSIYPTQCNNPEIPWLAHTENILTHFKYNGGSNGSQNDDTTLRVNSIVQSSLSYLTKVFESTIGGSANTRTSINKKLENASKDNNNTDTSGGDSYFEGWESLFNDEDDEEEQQHDSDNNDSENDSDDSENENKEGGSKSTKSSSSTAIQSNIKTLLPSLLNFIIDTLVHYRGIYKKSLVDQLSGTSNPLHVKLVQELYILSLKSEVLEVMKSLDFSTQDRAIVEQWDEEYRPNCLVSKEQKQLFSWSLQPYNPKFVEGKVYSIALQSIIKLLLTLSNQALVHWDSLNESNPESTKPMLSKVSELIYEQVYISTDRSFSFLEDHYDNYSSLISGAQSGYLINQIKLANFESICQVLIEPSFNNKLFIENSYLLSILIGYLDSLISISKLNGSHIYCYYISGFNGSVARGTRDFEFVLPTGDLKILIQVLFNNPSEKFNLKVLTALVHFMSISTPSEFFTSFRSHAINIFSSIPSNDLKVWFEQKLLGINNSNSSNKSNIGSVEKMEIENILNVDEKDSKSSAPTMISSTISIQEQIIRLIGLLIGNKDLSCYSKDYLAQQAAAAAAAVLAAKESEELLQQQLLQQQQEQANEGKKKKKVSGSSTPVRSAVSTIGKKVTSSSNSNSSPALTASSSPPSLEFVDWDEKISSTFSVSLFDILLSSINTAFTDWIEQPKLLKGYFELLQYIAMEQHQLLKLFNQVSNLSSPILTNPSIDQLESLNLLVEFIENILDLSKSLKKQPIEHQHHCRHKNHHGQRKDEMMIDGKSSTTTTVLEEDILKDDVEALDDEDDEDHYFSEDEKTNGSGNENNNGEDDGDDEERKLSSKVCTYTFTKNDYIDQHWYFCYTCGLKFSEGCCSVCAKVCHKGHQVSYSRYSRFFCDCGAGAGKGSSCKALKPRLYTPPKPSQDQSSPSLKSSNNEEEQSSQIESTTATTDQQSLIPDSNSLLSPSSASSSSSSTSSTSSNSNATTGGNSFSSINSYFFNLPTQQDKEELFNEIFNDKSNIIGRISDLYPKLIEMYKKAQSDLIKPKSDSSNSRFEIFDDTSSSMSTTREIVNKTDIFTTKKVSKYGTFDAKLKLEGIEGNQLKSLLSSGPIQRRAIASTSKGLLAIAEGDNVSIYNSSKILDDDAQLDKHSFKALSKSQVAFPIVGMVFNPANEKFLAVVGYKECKILTINQKDEIVDQLVIDLSLDALGETIYIIKVEWIIGSQVELAVVTNEFIKVYDLSKDNLSPIHFFSLLEDSIKDMCLVQKNNKNHILALSNYGLLYFQAIEDSIDNESCIMIETLQVPVNKTSAGVSVHYNSELDLVIASYNNGECYAFQVNDSMTLITRSFPIMDPSKKLPMPAQFFQSLSPMFPNIYACLATRGGYLLGFKLGVKEISIQNLKLTPKVEGMTLLNRSSSQPKLLILFDDGSIGRYDFNVDSDILNTQASIPIATIESASNIAVEDNKKGLELLLYLKSKYLEKNNIGATSANSTTATPTTTTTTTTTTVKPTTPVAPSTVNSPVFPIDFFESTECITPNVKYGGDPLQWFSQDIIKQKLASNDEYIVCQSLDTLTLVVMNNNFNNAICGIRVLVGNASTKHIPSEIKIFNRSVPLKEGQRRWYDIPFTNEEAMKSIKKVSFTAGSTFTMGTSPIIDQVEVYAKNKDSLGFSDSDNEDDDSLPSVDENVTSSGISKTTSNTGGLNDSEKHTPIETVILHCFNSLKNYFSNHAINDESSQQFTILKEKTLAILPSMITDSQLTFVRSSIKKLLKILSTDSDHYQTLKHSIQLKYASQTILSMVKESTSVLDFEKFDYLVKALNKISSSSPKNMELFLFNQHSNFLIDLFTIFNNATQPTNGNNNTGSGSGNKSKTINSTISIIYSESFISNMVQFLWNILAAKLFKSGFIFGLLKSLFYHSNEIIRTRSSLILVSLISRSGNSFNVTNTIKDVASTVPTTTTTTENSNIDVQMVDEILFSCDLCGVNPITGKRWNCNTCGDFDLCNACYQNPDKDHPIDHQFKEFIIDEPMKDEQPKDQSKQEDQETKQQDHQNEYDEDLKLAISMSLGDGNNNNTTDDSSMDTSNSTTEEEVPILEFIKLILNEINVVYEKGFTYMIPYMQILYSTILYNASFILNNTQLSNQLVSTLVAIIAKHKSNLSKFLVSKSNNLEGDLLVFSLLSLLLDSDEQKRQKIQSKQQSTTATTAPSSSNTVTPTTTAAAVQQQHSLPSTLIYHLSKLFIDKDIIQLLRLWIDQLYICISEASSHSIGDEKGGKDSPFGALLTSTIDENQTLPKNRFTPFFGKYLPQSLISIHLLLSKSIFKLMITFYRCERRKKTISNGSNNNNNQIIAIKPSEWTNVICSFIHSKKTASIVKYPKKLLFLIYQTKSSYYSIRDEFLLKKKFSGVQDLEVKTNGFQDEISYDHLAKLISYLTLMLEVASDRPKSWQFFCAHNDVVPKLYKILFNLSEEPLSLLLELLTFVFVDESIEQKKSVESEKPPSTEAVVQVSQQQENESDILMQDIDISKSKHISTFLDQQLFDVLVYNILLESNSSDLRSIASSFIYYLWKCSNSEQRVLINKSLWTKLNHVASYGKNANEFMDLLTYFINETDPESWKDQHDEFTNNLINSFKSQNQISLNHPNSQIYNSLGKILEFDGYYLESEPCLVCNNPEVQYQTLRLESLKQEVKFSESSQLIKFNGVYNISKILIQLHDVKKGKMIKTINLFYNNKPVADIGDLKGKFNQWKKLKQVHFTPSQTEKSVTFQIPISARNFMIEYFDFHDNLQVSSTEKLQCPRCSRIVTDKHGICKNCHENAYQCKHCRNINYENLDAFLCNECGFCKHAKFDYSFVCKPTIAIEKIENQEDHKRAIATIEKESENAHKKYQRLIGFKKVIANLINSFETQEPWSKEDLVKSSGGTITIAPTPSPLPTANQSINSSGNNISANSSSSNFNIANQSSSSGGSGGSGGIQSVSSAASNNSSSFLTLRINKKIGYLSRLYERECRNIYEGLSKSVQILQTNRLEISKYMNFISNNTGSSKQQQHSSSHCQSVHIRDENKCYGCSNSFIEQVLCLLNSICKNSELTSIKDQLVSKGLPKEIFFNNIHHGKSIARSWAKSSLAYLVKSNLASNLLLNQWIKEKVYHTLDYYTSIDVPNMISNEMSLLKDCASLSDSIWPTRLNFVMDLFLRALAIGSQSPVVSEYIVLPCLKIIVHLVTLDRKASSNFANKDSKDIATAQKLLESRFEKLKSSKKHQQQAIAAPTTVTSPSVDKRSIDPSILISPTTASNIAVSVANSSLLSPSQQQQMQLQIQQQIQLQQQQLLLQQQQILLQQQHREAIQQQQLSSSGGSASESGSEKSIGSGSGGNSASSSVSSSTNDPNLLSMFDNNETNDSWDGEDNPVDAWTLKYENFLFNFGNSSISSPATKTTTSTEDELKSKYFTKWLNQVKKNKISKSFEVLFEDQWLKKLLFNSTFTIRLEIITLMGILSKSSNSRSLLFLDLLTKLLPDAIEAGEYSAEFFGLFNSFLSSQSQDRKIYLAVKGFIPLLCDSIIKEIDRIRSKEGSFSTDISQGFVLKTLVGILKSFLDVPTLKDKMKKDNMLEKVLDAFLSLRGVVVQKNKLTEDSVKYLTEIMKSLNNETVEDNKKFMAANIKALVKYQNDGRTPIFIFEQLCNIVCPTKPEPVYQLILFKASSQEEYIRGSMNRNPYASNTFGGNLMRDVKNKICKTLDLGSFLEDDNGMELLVDNKIIKLDLPIAKVYELVWKRSPQAMRSADINIPMNVVYRLQGLDGEATEEIIETLNDNSSEEKDPEVEFEITSVMAECGGLESMLSIIERINDFSIEKELAQLVIKLLYHCSKIKVNRQKLMALNAVGRLLEKLKSAFHQPELSEHLLIIIESVVSEANRDYLVGSNSSTASLSHHKDINEAQEQINMFLDKLNSPHIMSSPKIIQAITRIIPFLTYGHVEIMEYLVNFFIPYLDFKEFDQSKHKDSNYAYHLDFFSKVMESTRPDSNGKSIRSLIIEKGITSSLIAYLVENFPENKDKSSQEWLSALEKPALPFVLVLLKGLAIGHQPTQDLIIETSNLIKRIHLLEETAGTSAKTIGSLAENLLEAIAEGNEKSNKIVSDIRSESKLEKRKQAELHRQNVLKELGLAQAGKSITANVVPGSIEDLEDDEGFTCMVCREGYSYKPDDVLGIYTYSKRIPLSSIGETTLISKDGSSGALSFGFTTVTHFNFIHFNCHRDATKADRNLKVPKSEWEGSALRNQQTQCNGLFPIIPPKMSSDSFIPYSDKYWVNLNNISRIDGPRFRILTHDLKFLFIRLSKDESFSTDSKGGGKESNIRIAPFFVQMGMFLLDQKLVGGNSANQLRRPQFEKILQTFTTMPLETTIVSMNQLPSDNVPYYLVMSLFFLSVKEWETQKLNYLNKLIAYSFFDYIITNSKHGLSTPEEPSKEKLFEITRPWFIFFSLISKFHSVVKPSSSDDTNWIQETKTYLATSFTKIQADVKELLTTFEDELKEFADESEFLDDLNLYKQVLQVNKDSNEYLLKIYKQTKLNITKK